MVELAATFFVAYCMLIIAALMLRILMFMADCLTPGPSFPSPPPPTKKREWQRSVTLMPGEKL